MLAPHAKPAVTINAARSNPQANTNSHSSTASALRTNNSWRIPPAAAISWMIIRGHLLQLQSRTMAVHTIEQLRQAAIPMIRHVVAALPRSCRDSQADRLQQALLGGVSSNAPEAREISRMHRHGHKGPLNTEGIMCITHTINPCMLLLSGTWPKGTVRLSVASRGTSFSSKWRPIQLRKRQAPG